MRMLLAALVGLGVAASAQAAAIKPLEPASAGSFVRVKMKESPQKHIGQPKATARQVLPCPPHCGGQKPGGAGTGPSKPPGGPTTGSTGGSPR